MHIGTAKGFVTKSVGRFSVEHNGATYHCAVIQPNGVTELRLRDYDYSPQQGVYVSTEIPEEYRSLVAAFAIDEHMLRTEGRQDSITLALAREYMRISGQSITRAYLEWRYRRYLRQLREMERIGAKTDGMQKDSEREIRNARLFLEAVLLAR